MLKNIWWHIIHELYGVMFGFFALIAGLWNALHLLDAHDPILALLSFVIGTSCFGYFFFRYLEPKPSEYKSKF